MYHGGWLSIGDSKYARFSSLRSSDCSKEETWQSFEQPGDRTEDAVVHRSLSQYPNPEHYLRPVFLYRMHARYINDL